MSENKNFFCTRSFLRLEARQNGKVHPCCPGWCNDYSFGNFYEESFANIWNSKKAVEFRRSILDGSYRFCNKLCLLLSNKEIMGEFLSESEIINKYTEKMDYPKMPVLSHDQQCNIRCRICRDHQIYNSSENTERLNSRIFEVFLPMVSNADSVTLSGSGEALASKHSRNLIKLMAEKYPKLKFNLYSNGLLLNERNFKELGITDRINNIIISLHATTKKTYDKIVLDSDFYEIIKNIEWLSKMKKIGNDGIFQLVFVVSLINYKEMIPFIKMARTYEACTNFLEYTNFGSKMGEQYKKWAVFTKEHPHYNKFVKIVNNDIFKGNDCIMPAIFQNLKPISTTEWLKYRLKDYSEVINRTLQKIHRPSLIIRGYK